MTSANTRTLGILHVCVGSIIVLSCTAVQEICSIGFYNCVRLQYEQPQVVSNDQPRRFISALQYSALLHRNDTTTIGTVNALPKYRRIKGLKQFRKGGYQPIRRGAQASIVRG